MSEKVYRLPLHELRAVIQRTVAESFPDPLGPTKSGYNTPKLLRAAKTSMETTLQQLDQIVSSALNHKEEIPVDVLAGIRDELEEIQALLSKL